MPRADAGVGLPRQGQDAGGFAAFDVVGQRLALLVVEHLGVHHGFVVAVQLDAGIVEMRGEVEADFIRHPVQRKNVVVEINHVGLVIVPKLFDAFEIFFHVGFIRHAAALGDAPIPGEFFAGRVVLRVEVLRIEAVPPLAFAVGLGELAVVRHAGHRAVGVRALCHLIPRPCVRGVNADGEAQAVFPRRRRPAANQVLVRTDVDGIPRLVC